MRMDDFPGDLTDISAKKKSLIVTAHMCLVLALKGPPAHRATGLIFGE